MTRKVETFPQVTGTNDLSTGVDAPSVPTQARTDYYPLLRFTAQLTELPTGMVDRLFTVARHEGLPEALAAIWDRVRMAHRLGVSAENHALLARAYVDAHAEVTR